uniref:Uncharacterized protein AlNc14C464G11793 n=1 Tax=Albugo laibachii Nc14 TaxID=890382 RepID=F0X055_9STRA|nr:conserved hypothetical protein [Albugo laibachii Nc14]|eukprot:CCA27137.1 conserved hypothetical protein [Albugo laibachii Nc14]
MLLGRALFHALPNYGEITTKEDATTEQYELSKTIALNDSFFSDLKELIPSNYYISMDNEKNWLQSLPSNAKKYHKNQKATTSTESTKNSSKRAKFNPSKEKKIEKNQIEGAVLSDEDSGKLNDKVKSLRATPCGGGTLESLKERLAAKVESLRQKRTAKSEGKQTNHAKRLKTKSASKPAPSTEKKQCTSSEAVRVSVTSIGKGKNTQGDISTKENDCTSSESIKSKEASTEKSKKNQGDTNLSYGNLLLDQEEQETSKKITRNGQAIYGIKNLLKKAEKKQKRMEELKKTEEGKALVESRQWKHAIEQAKGEVLRDDPVLLRKKLKKKEKQKEKSAKSWNERTTLQKQQQRKKKNLRAGKKRSNDNQRAGFEGKHGKTFLNRKEKGA